MNSKTRISVTPAILPKTFAELNEKLSFVVSRAGRVQIDACDGDFVPNKTWPYEGDSERHFEKIIKQEEGLPYCEDFNFEIDLMVSNPAFEADKWIAAGASALVVHVQSVELSHFVVLAKNIKDKGIELILGVEMSASLEDVQTYVHSMHGNGDRIDGIQCMGIRKEGFQHQQFDVAVLDKIKEIHAAFPDMPISVDGGVNLENAKILQDAGATRLIVGSAIFNTGSAASDSQENTKEKEVSRAIAEFENILN